MIGYFKKYKFLKISLVLGMFFYLAGNANAQSLQIRATFDTSKILIGDQLKFRMQVVQPSNAVVQWPELVDTLNSKIEILSSEQPDTVKKDNVYSITREYLVTAFDSGYYVIKPFAFPFRMGLISDTLYSSPTSLLVQTIPMDTVTQIKDIVPPLNTPYILAESKLYIILGLAVILIGVIIWFLIKHYRKEPVFVKRKVVEPAHVTALRDLDNLRAEKLWQNNKVKLYYTRVTEILRVYIEQRFKISAMEQTSDEILQSFNNVYLEDKEQLLLLRKIFDTADLVKFAKLEPLPDENEICLLDAYQFVNNTKLIDIPEAGIESNSTEEGVEEITTDNQGNTVYSHRNLPPQSEKQQTLATGGENLIVKILAFPKKFSLKLRIGVLLICILGLALFAIPDFIFNLEQSNIPSFSIDELKQMSDNQIPRYLTIKDAVIPSGSYIREAKKSRLGVETLQDIVYPVYPESNDSSAHEAAYVVVKDSKVNEDELKSGNYFNSPQFFIGGRFSNERIPESMRQMFEQHEIPVSQNAILIEKNEVPMSFVQSLIISILGILLSVWLILSFLQKKAYVKMFSSANNRKSSK